MNCVIICCGHNIVVTILLLQVIGSTTAKISRVGHAHPDFFQGGRLPTLLPPVPAPMVPCLTLEVKNEGRMKITVGRKDRLHVTPFRDKKVKGQDYNVTSSV